MSNATHDSRSNSGESSRRRRSRGGSRNRNNQNRNENRSGGDRGSRDSRGQSHGGSRKDSQRSEEFRPQAPRKYAPPKKTWWQKILSAIGLYKEPTPPSRYDRKPAEAGKQESIPFPKTSSPKSNTRNARSGEADSRPPREPREPREKREPREPREKRAEGERSPRNSDRPRGGDPKSVGSTRVYVGNLSYDVTEQDLQELFKGVGGVRNVEVVYNRSTHRSKGYGFVEMLRMDEAVRAVEVLHDQPFMGRKLTVSGAKSKGQDEREDSEPEREPTKVVLAPLPPAAEVATPVTAAAAVAVSEPVIETIVEAVAQQEATAEAVAAVAEEAPAPAADDLVSKYGFDEPKKTEEA